MRTVLLTLLLAWLHTSEVDLREFDAVQQRVEGPEWDGQPSGVLAWWMWSDTGRWVECETRRIEPGDTPAWRNGAWEWESFAGRERFRARLLVIDGAMVSGVDP